MSVQTQQVLLMESGEVVIREQTLPHVGPQDVLVESLCSLLSSGTERIIIKRDFDAGSHWDRWIRYPFPLGYASIGRVIEVGKQVSTSLLGQTVALRVPHASHHVVGTDSCIQIGESVCPSDAVWFALARIGFLAVHSAGTLGDLPIVVVGGGLIAQMVVRWLSIQGATRIAVMTTNRLQAQIARSGGATGVASHTTHSCSPREITRIIGYRPSIIFDCTSDSSVAEWALMTLNDYGRLILVGDTGKPRERRLTEDILLRSLSIVGAHDSCTFGRWTDSTVATHFFSNVQCGRFRLDGLVSHTYAATEAASAYTLLSKSRETRGIILDWARLVDEPTTHVVAPR